MENELNENLEYKGDLRNIKKKISYFISKGKKR